jgi:phosphatidylinositol alpha-mannosyltransferase
VRVCLVSAAYRPFPSGVSEHVHHLGRELRNRGHEVAILTTNYSGTVRDDLPVTRLGRVLILPANRSFITLPVGVRLAADVRRFLYDGHHDIIHCHGLFWPEISYWAIRYSIAPVIVTFHTLGVRSPRPVTAAYRAAFADVARRVRARIAVSQAGRAWAENWLPGHYDVIPNGVDTSRFSPDATPPPAMAGPGPTVLFVGRLDERKGLPILIRAMPDVLRGRPDSRLVVVGIGPQERLCRHLAARLGIGSSVHFAGRVPFSELPGYYAGCTVFCSPALGGEAMGIVLVEAMSSARPVVASAIPGYDEVITNGTDGLLFPRGDPAALASALLRVLNQSDVREALSRGALGRAQDFAWPKVCARIEDVYHRVLS